MWVAYVLQLFGGGGYFGFHRFYLGFKRSAKIQLALGIATFLLPFIIGRSILLDALTWVAVAWNIIDLFLIPGMVRAANSGVVPSESRSE